MRSVAVRASSCIALAAGVLSLSGVALGDAVPPPPDNCPEGQVGVTSHRGPKCVLEAPKNCAPGYRGQRGGTCVLAECGRDGACEVGTHCVQVDVCQEEREQHWTGWGWSPYEVGASGGRQRTPLPVPSGAPPKAWVNLRICGQDGPCADPAKCRPAGLCYADPVVAEQKVETVKQAPPARSGGCSKGCTVATTPETTGWFALPFLALARLRRRRRIAAARAIAIVAAMGLLLLSSVALADALPPPPDDCPKGQVGVTSHGGPACVREAPKDCAPGYRGETGGACVLAACSSDQECEAGRRCVQVDTCQELRELNWDGWGWRAQRARSSGNLLGGPPRPAPSEDAPEAWVKLRICGQDGPCDSPAECRPMGLCYLTAAIGKTKAKVVAAPPVAEELPEGVYSNSLIAADGRAPDDKVARESSGSCRKGCSVASTPELIGWFALPLLATARLRRRRRR